MIIASHPQQNGGGVILALPNEALLVSLEGLHPLLVSSGSPPRRCLGAGLRLLRLRSRLLRRRVLWRTLRLRCALSMGRRLRHDLLTAAVSYGYPRDRTMSKLRTWLSVNETFEREGAGAAAVDPAERGSTTIV